jgi:multicomponent Na+:H+ antiporter subunit C
MIALTYAILVGILMSCGIYLLLQRSLVRIVLGLTMVSNAANLLLFSSGKFSLAKAPLISGAAQTLEAPYADPLPQALILTAIVIGFGVISFFLVLCYKTFENLNTDNIDEMRSTES